MASLEGKKVTVMGLGLHGGALGTIQWLRRQKAIITVTDVKSDQQLHQTLEQLRAYPEITFVLGQHREQDFTSADLIIRNPAVPRTSKFLQLANEAGVPVEMDSSLFFAYCPSRTIIGITGSKGKSTATHVIAHLLQLCYPQTVTVGIDGRSPLGALEHVTADSLVVFELSSWRLEALAPKNMSPPTAVVTALYQDHLNTYDSYDHYIDTKKVIIRYQHARDRALLNADDILLRSWEREIAGQLYWFSLNGSLPAGGEGIYVSRGEIYVRLQRESYSLFPISSLPFASDHARRNTLPGILLGFLNNIPIASIELQVRNLEGLAHRLEKVRTLNAVTYINDSAATMPDATIAALKALRHHHLVHILGGSDKKLNFEQLARAEAQARLRALVFLPGDATDRIKRQIGGEFGNLPPTHDASSMVEAVSLAQRAAKPGDYVLLSPAATSFGLFQHEFDRGNQFKEAVNNLS